MCSANYVPIRGVNGKFQTACAECLLGSLDLHTKAPNLSCGSQSLMWILWVLIWCENCAETHLNKGIAALQCQACFVQLQSFLGAGSLSQWCPREGTPPPRCWMEAVTSVRDSQKHTCVRENLERKLISSNQKRDYHWINIYATQAIKGPGNRTEWGEKVLENVVAPVAFVRVVVKDYRNIRVRQPGISEDSCSEGFIKHTTSVFSVRQAQKFLS